MLPLTFAKRTRFSSSIFTTCTPSSAPKVLVGRWLFCESGGILQINAAYGGREELDAIIDYQESTSPDHEQKFDGVISELEWWRTGSNQLPWATCKDLIKRAYKKLPDIQRWVYIGQPTVKQIAWLVEHVTHMAIHTYVKNPEYVFNAAIGAEAGHARRVESLTRKNGSEFRIA